MTTITSPAIINQDGEFVIESASGKRVLLEWEITAGTATVAPGYGSQSGGFFPASEFSGLAFKSNGSHGGKIALPLFSSSRAALKVSAATGDFSMKVIQTKAKG